MMAQTGMAPSHGRGTQHTLPFHPPVSWNHLLSPPNCSYISYLLQSFDPSSKPAQAAPPPAEIPSEAPVPVPFVQVKNEKEERKKIQKTKAIVPSHMAIQSNDAYLAPPHWPPQGWLSRGALRLRLFVLFQPSLGQLLLLRHLHRSLDPLVLG